MAAVLAEAAAAAAAAALLLLLLLLLAPVGRGGVGCTARIFEKMLRAALRLPVEAKATATSA